MMALRSSLRSAAVELAETSQLSKAENKIEVEMPPRTRAKSKTGREGTRSRPHVSEYVTQNVRHNRRRPLDNMW